MGPLALATLLTLLPRAGAELAAIRPYVSSEPWLGEKFKLPPVRVPLLVQQCETLCEQAILLKAGRRR